MPHVAAVITNLADDLTLVDRMRDSITGELQRRQELLRDAGNYANIHDYEKARAAGAPLEPLPSLVMVIDEFSELLTAKPDFIDMFIQIGRIGRSLGVHLLLASQRLEEGRLRGLDTYLSYRIGLRTFSAAESRAAIGVPDAYHLPSVPGSGLSEVRHRDDGPVQGGVRLGRLPHRAGGGRARARCRPDRLPVPFTAAPVAVQVVEPSRRLAVPAPRAARATTRSPTPCWTSSCGGWRARARRRTRCGCRRWTGRPRSTSCCRRSPVTERGLHAAEYPRLGKLVGAARPGGQAVRAAARRAVPGLLRRGRSRAGRRRPAVRQVDADAHR